MASPSELSRPRFVALIMAFICLSLVWVYGLYRTLEGLKVDNLLLLKVSHGDDAKHVIRKNRAPVGVRGSWILGECQIPDDQGADLVEAICFPHSASRMHTMVWDEGASTRAPQHLYLVRRELFEAFDHLLQKRFPGTVAYTPQGMPLVGSVDQESFEEQILALECIPEKILMMNTLADTLTMEEVRRMQGSHDRLKFFHPEVWAPAMKPVDGLVDGRGKVPLGADELGEAMEDEEDPDAGECEFMPDL